jgi:hypothetical protein
MIQNIRQVRDRINAEFARLGILGDSVINTNGLRAKANLTMITVHNYDSPPFAVWVEDPETVVAVLKQCQPLNWNGKPSFPTERAWLRIEATDVTPHELTVADVLGWDID